MESKEVAIPKENEVDFEEIELDIKKILEVHFVTNYTELAKILGYIK